MRPPVRSQTYLIVFVFISAVLLAVHLPWLSTPYFWDEIGQFIPAALDLYQDGTWIPHTTLPNVHPPGLVAYLAAVWSVAGLSIEHTRTAMLLVAALGALSAFLLSIELGRGAPGTPAFVSLLLLCVSPLFFSQSMMALLDMPAMMLTSFALLMFLQNRFRASAAVCVLLVLVKETGLVAPAVFGFVLVREKRLREAAWFLLPVPVLGGWLLVLHQATGHWLGNAEFARYNIWYPWNPVRLGLAFVRRAYYLFLSSGHFIGTAALIYAWRRMPLLRDRSWRIAFTFAIAHIVAVSVTGGAVLERYLLPVLPILYAAFAISFLSLPNPWRWRAPAALVVLLITAIFVFPLYPFPLENNLAWTTFARLEEQAARPLEFLPEATVATAFPLSDALRRPEFGYVRRKRAVTQVNTFRASDLLSLRLDPPDCLIVFTQTWDPLHLLQHPWLARLFERYYGYEPEASVSAIEKLLSMRATANWRSRGFEFTLLNREDQAQSIVRLH